MKRIAVLLYGVISYAVFFPTFCYAIGFVGGLVVPKDIDDGPVTPWVTALLVDAGLLGLFAVQHNIMARRGFKRVWTKIVPEPIERSTFVLIASGLLILLFWQWRPLPDIVWSVSSPLASGALWALYAAGWAIVLASTFIIDHFDLFGLKQTYLYARGQRYAQPRFKEAGLYKMVRHPLMLGFVIAFWAAPTMTVGRLAFASITTVWILIALRIEERDLMAAHGEYYESYRRRVPMLLPLPKRSSAKVSLADR